MQRIHQIRQKYAGNISDIKTVSIDVNQTYVATGKFSRDFGKRLGRLKRKREVSDYDDFYVASNEEAIEQYESAELIVNQVERYLMKMDINI